MAKKKTEKTEEVVEVEVSAEAVVSEAPVEVAAEVKPVEVKPAAKVEKTEVKIVGNTVVKGNKTFAF